MVSECTVTANEDVPWAGPRGSYLMARPSQIGKKDAEEGRGNVEFEGGKGCRRSKGAFDFSLTQRV